MLEFTGERLVRDMGQADIDGVGSTPNASRRLLPAGRAPAGVTRAMRALLYGSVAPFALLSAGPAFAQCATATVGGVTTLTCDDTVTTDSSNANGNNPSTNANFQLFSTAIDAKVDAGRTVSGYGLLLNGSGSGAITVTNNGTISNTSGTADQSIAGGLRIVGNSGDLTYLGSGNATTTFTGAPAAGAAPVAGLGMESDSGAVTLGSALAPVTGTFRGPAAISLSTFGARDINAFIDGGLLDATYSSSLSMTGRGGINLSMTGNTVMTGSLDIANWGGAPNAAYGIAVATDAHIGTVAAPVRNAINIDVGGTTGGLTSLNLTGTAAIVGNGDAVSITRNATAPGAIELTTAAGTTINAVGTPAFGVNIQGQGAGAITLDLGGSIASALGGVLVTTGDGATNVTIRQGAKVSGAVNALEARRAFGATGTSDTLVLGSLTSPNTAATFDGTLRIGDGGTTGTVSGNMINDGKLFFNRSDAISYAGVVSGTGSLTKQGAGTLTLTGDNTYTGKTEVRDGTLLVDGNLASGAAVLAGAELGGKGAIAGTVTLADTSKLLGRSGQTLTMGLLSLSSNSQTDVALGAPNTDALFKVQTDLYLDGALNVTDAGGFGKGTYRLFDYGGALTDDGLVIASLPAGFNPGDWSIDTSTGGQISLLVPAIGAGEQYWDGGNNTPGGVADGRGGAGRWGSGTNWTNQAGTINAPWANQKAVFAGTAGDIIVDAGGVYSSGLDFRTSGYNLTGGAINLTAGAKLNVAGDANSAVYMSAPLIGAGDFTKTGPGLWTGKGTFAGLVTIDGGSVYLYDSYAAGMKTINSQGAVIGGSLGSNATVSSFSAFGGWDAGNADFVIGDAGTGTLKLYGGVNTNPPEIKADRVVLGRAATGHGTLWISGDLFGPGKVSATEVVGGTGGGDVIFRSANRFSPKLTGNLAVSVENGEVRLSGLHDYTGPTVVQRQSGVGTATAALTLDGATLTGTPVKVGVGGTLGGQGTVTGAVTLAGGTLKGASGQTLSLGSVVMDEASTLNLALGAPGNTTGLFKVNGNLTLDGTLNATDAGGFGQGVYRIFDYGGALTDNGLKVGTLPSDTGTVQTAVAKQVNLVVSGGSGGATEFWNGAQTSADGSIHGGSGTWIAGPTNWTNANGTTVAPWGGQFAIFQNNPGVVTVDKSAGAISTTGMQFIGSGWRVKGDPVTLDGAGGSTTIRVGDGTSAGASSTATIASQLTGSSRLVKSDLGELILTGANSYKGGTTINAGSLQIGDGVGGTSGSIVGDVTNNSLLRFGRSDATTFAGTISGTGMTQILTGNVTLTADNTYTGGTSVLNGASLSVGNGGKTGSIGAPGYIFVGGSLIFNRSNDLTIGGSMVGTGSLRQIGSGKTELAGDFNQFTGATTVENGTLAVNGRLGGALDVLAGGRLQGIGTAGDTIVSGVIAPGNSIGTLGVGNITFNAGSVYEVEVDAAGKTDLIAASGTATIAGGTVRVLAGAGNYAPATTYNILTAQGGLTANSAFSDVTSNLAFLDPSLSYDANNVRLTMTRNTVTFNNVGITPNQIAAGGGVESLGLGDPVYNAALNLSAPQARRAFDQLSGEIHASAATTMIEDSRFLRSAVNDRLRAAFDGVGAAATPVTGYADGGPHNVPATTDGFALWGQAFGSWGHWNSDGNAARLNRSTGGVFVGADAPMFDSWRFGAIAGYSRTNFDVRDRASSGSSDNYHLGLYGGTSWGDLAFRTGAAYTWHDITTNRSVVFPGFGDSLKGKYDAATAQVFGELAYGVNMGTARFEPFANLAYVNLHTDGFGETGGPAALTSPSANTAATFTTLGLRASTALDLGEAAVTAKGMLGWRHAFGDATPDAAMRFASGGDAFSVGGVPIARNAAVVEAGLDFNLSPGAVLGVSYGGQFGSGVTDQTFRANFSMKF